MEMPNEIKQGTEAWFKQRLGKITASRFSVVLTNPRSKKDREEGKMSKTGETYIKELIAETLTGVTKKLEGEALEWGTEHEPEAREFYELNNIVEVTECGFIEHADLEDVGGSPDGLIGDDGMIEIKCPFNPVNHINYLLNEDIPKTYIAQIQGNMWITNRKWCDFISYDPRIEDDKLKMKVIRVERDNGYIGNLEKQIIKFRENYKLLFNKIK